GAVLVEAAVAAAVLHRVHLRVPGAVAGLAALAGVTGVVLLGVGRLAALVLARPLGGHSLLSRRRRAVRRRTGAAGVRTARIMLVVVGVLLALRRVLGGRLRSLRRALVRSELVEEAHPEAEPLGVRFGRGLVLGGRHVRGAGRGRLLVGAVGHHQ